MSHSADHATTLWVRATYTLTGLTSADRFSKLPPFVTSVEGHRVTITFKEDDKADAVAHLPVSLGLADKLRANDWEPKTWSPRLRRELLRFSKLPRRGFAKLYDLLKYVLRNQLLHEIAGSRLPHEWSADGVTWSPLPFGFVMGGGRTLQAASVDQTLHDQLQAMLDREQTLFGDAFRHLHRAMHDYPRHAWINATIAAELAIKEFLIRFKPDIRTLLIEVPSPPLHKLYGPVLKSLTGEESPKVKALAKGAEVRNKLIHRPGESVSTERTTQYVLDVETALFHLLTLLYPDNALLKQEYAKGLRSVVSPFDPLFNEIEQSP